VPTITITLTMAVPFLDHVAMQPSTLPDAERDRAVTAKGRPPRKRKPVAIEAQRIIDSKTRIARRRPGEVTDAADAVDPKKSRRPRWREGRAAAEEANATARPRAGEAQPSTKPPAPANDDGPRKSAVIVVKSGRRPGLSEAAAEVSHRQEPAMASQLTRPER